MQQPRTPREFANAGMIILVACRCGHEQHLDPLMVEFTHGEHFDLVVNWRELETTLYCAACGTRSPIITYAQSAVAELLRVS